MNKGLLGLLVVLTMTFTVPSQLQAAGNIWEKAQSERYGEKAGAMFGRGLLNVATSPLDLVVQTVESTKQGPPLIGTLGGLGGGLGCTAIRASSGIIDVLTFWVPDFNGFTVSRSYSNCLETERSQAGMQDYAAPQQHQSAQQGRTVVGQSAPQDTSEEGAMKYIKKGTKQSSGQHDPNQYIKKGTGSSDSQNRSAYIK